MRDLGCAYGQGYHFARPTAGSAVAGRLRSARNGRRPRRSRRRVGPADAIFRAPFGDSPGGRHPSLGDPEALAQIAMPPVAGREPAETACPSVRRAGSATRPAHRSSARGVTPPRRRPSGPRRDHRRGGATVPAQRLGRGQPDGLGVGRGELRLGQARALDPRGVLGQEAVGRSAGRRPRGPRTASSRPTSKSASASPRREHGPPVGAQVADLLRARLRDDRRWSRRPRRTTSGRGAARRPAGPWTARPPAPREGTGRRGWRRGVVCPCPMLARRRSPTTAPVGPGAWTVSMGLSDPCRRRASRRGCRARRRPPVPPVPAVPPAPPSRPPSSEPMSGTFCCAAWFRPPSGTFPLGRQHVDDLRQEGGQQRQQRRDVDAALGREALDLVRPECGAELLRIDRLVRAGAHPRCRPRRSARMPGACRRADRGRPRPGSPWRACRWWPLHRPGAPTGQPAEQAAEIVHRVPPFIPERTRSRRARRSYAARPVGPSSPSQPGSGSGGVGTEVGRSHAQVLSRLSSRRPVRSRWIGVTAMRRLTIAWKSVPGTASPDGGGPPIQK